MITSDTVVKVVYKHWKTGKELEVIGKLIPINENSDRIVVLCEDGVYEDIIRDTIISQTPI